jgi:hypothetical protein
MHPLYKRKDPELSSFDQAPSHPEPWADLRLFTWILEPDKHVDSDAITLSQSFMY